MSHYHVTHYMVGNRRSACGHGSSSGHPIADVRLGSADWSEVTCRRCLQSRVRDEATQARLAQRKATPEPELTLEVPKINPVKRDGMQEVKAFWGNKVGIWQGDTLLKEFPVTSKTVSNIIKYCDRHNLFPVNVKDGKVWIA